MEDRDWYREERHKRSKNTRHFEKTTAPTNWFVIVLFWTVLLFGLFQLAKHVHRFTFSSPFAVAPRDAAPAPAPAIVSNVEMQHQPSRTHQHQEQHIRLGQAPLDPSADKGTMTIYRCKAYSGGVFWSSVYCGNQQALIDRTATVPKALSFEQQVQIAEGLRVEAMALYNQQPSPADQRANGCVALKRERDTIESRYSNWQWQPPEVVNPDQTRMRGLRAEQARLGCPTQ